MTDDTHAEDAAPAAENATEEVPPAAPEDRHALERALVARILPHVVATLHWMSDAELRTLARVPDDGDALRLTLALARARAEDGAFEGPSDDVREPLPSVESFVVEDAIQELIAIAEQMFRESGTADAAAAGFDTARWVRAWIEAPSGPLGGQRPVELLGDAEGREMVQSLLRAQQTGAFW